MTAVALEATRIRVRGATVLGGVYALLGRAIAPRQGVRYTQPMVFEVVR
jgi:hypothetical protein